MNLKSNIIDSRKGFTLVELIISMLVFTIFMGAVSTVYISITRSLRHAAEVRQVYSEARFLMDKITQDARLYTIDYDCLYKTTLNESDSNECSNNNTFDSSTGDTSWLPLISNDGAKRVVYRYEADDQQLSILKVDLSASDAVAATGYYEGFAEFKTDRMAIGDMHFRIWPLLSPYHNTDAEYQFQPSINAVIEAYSTSTILPEVVTVTLQSAISSRVYGVSF
jgi:prepilin-type N-terminal cleavage/methylation domain-containing protein